MFQPLVTKDTEAIYDLLWQSMLCQVEFICIQLHNGLQAQNAKTRAVEAERATQEANTALRLLKLKEKEVELLADEAIKGEEFGR